MTADTLTPDGAAVTLGPTAPDERGDASTFLGYVAMPSGNDGIVTLTQSATNSGFEFQELTATGYDLSGNITCRTVLVDNVQNLPVGVGDPALTLLANGGVAVAWNEINGLTLAGQSTNAYAILSPQGAKLTEAFLPIDSGTDQYGSYTVPLMAPPQALYATADHVLDTEALSVAEVADTLVAITRELERADG